MNVSYEILTEIFAVVIFIYIFGIVAQLNLAFKSSSLQMCGYKEPILIADCICPALPNAYMPQPAIINPTRDCSESTGLQLSNLRD